MNAERLRNIWNFARDAICLPITIVRVAQIEEPGSRRRDNFIASFIYTCSVPASAGVVIATGYYDGGAALNLSVATYLLEGVFVA